jgi:single-stranded DNA-binding protein
VTVNEVQLSGRLTGEPHISSDDAGLRAMFGLAVPNLPGTHAAGTLLIDVVCWDEIAHTVARDLHGSSIVRVAGRLCRQEWNGRGEPILPRYEIVASRVTLADTSPFPDQPRAGPAIPAAGVMPSGLMTVWPGPAGAGRVA